MVMCWHVSGTIKGPGCDSSKVSKLVGCERLTEGHMALGLVGFYSEFSKNHWRVLSRGVT